MVKLDISVMMDEFSPDLEKVAAYLQQEEVHYVELRGVWKTNILNADVPTINRIKEILQRYDLKVSSISGGLLKCIPPSLNPSPPTTLDMFRNWKYNFSLIDHAIEVATSLKAPYIRCFGFHGFKTTQPLIQWEDWAIYNEWSQKIEEMKAKVKDANITWICENEGGLVKSLEEIEWIGQHHCGAGFGMLYDMANVANRYGSKGVLTDLWLPRIAKFIQFIHAKGCQQKWLGRHTSYINGPKDICRWPQVVAYFQDMHPSSFITPTPQPLLFSVETHMHSKNLANRWENSTQCLQNLRQLILK
jgi:sugar phosphate isomerase/epimerase